MVWKIQAQMVADIAGAFGKESFLAEEQMLYCLFRHAAAHSVRGIAVRAGERILIKRAPAYAVDTVLRRIGVPIARRIAGRGVSRWLPVIGAAGSPATPTTTRCASPPPRSSCSGRSSSRSRSIEESVELEVRGSSGCAIWRRLLTSRGPSRFLCSLPMRPLDESTLPERFI